MLASFLLGVRAHISPGRCQFQDGESLYSFYDLSNTLAHQRFVSDDGYTYYIRLCNSLTSDQVDTLFTPNISTTIARCKVGRCQELVHLSDYVYRILEAGDPNSGLIYSGDGPLVRDVDQANKYLEVHSRFYLKCDKDATSQNPNVDISVQTLTTNIVITVTLTTSRGCPSHTVATPTPTPHLDLNCMAEFLDPQDTTKGIQVDLSLTDNGYYGNRYFMKLGQEERIVYYNPCQPAMCPIDADCGNVKTANVWVCKQQNSQILCDSYGLGETPSYEVFRHPNNGFTATYKAGLGGATTKVHYICPNDNIPSGYNLVDQEGSIQDDYFTFTVSNSDACSDHFPDNPQGACTLSYTQGNYKIDADFSRVDDPAGVTTEVEALQGGMQETKTLMYKACDGLPCGNRYDCQGDENAYIWLCDKAKGIGNKPDCFAYGLERYQTKHSIIDGYIYNGVLSTYYADEGRRAEVTHVCNESATKPVLSRTVKVDGNILSFTVQDKEVCPIGSGPTPTPIPSPVPSTPEKTELPPIVPVQDNDYFYHKDDKFFYLRMSMFEDDYFSSEQTLYIDGDKGKVRSYVSPYKPIKCPNGYTCDPEDFESNIWTCWQKEDGTKYCYASGRFDFGVDIAPFDESELEKGLTISYKGAYGVDSKIDIECYRNHEPKSINDFTKDVSYGGLGSKFFTYTTRSDLGCPQSFVDVNIPRNKEKPAADPNATRTYYSDNGYPDEKSYKRSRLDLRKLPNLVREPVFVGSDTYFSKTDFAFSPMKDVMCPSEYNCSDFWPANSWECFNHSTQGSRCVPLSSIENQEISIEYFRVENHSENNYYIVNYKGGAANHQATYYIMCDPTLKAGEYLMRDVGLLYGGGNNVIINMTTSDICPRYYPSPITGGAVFLIIVFGGLTIYFFVGFLIQFVLKGEVSVPNAEFWNACIESVETGFLFIFTCGKRTTTTPNYDAI